MILIESFPFQWWLLMLEFLKHDLNTEGKTKTVGNVFLIVLGENDFSISQEGVCGDPGHYSRG